MADGCAWKSDFFKSSINSLMFSTSSKNAPLLVFIQRCEQREAGVVAETLVLTHMYHIATLQAGGRREKKKTGTPGMPTLKKKEKRRRNTFSFVHERAFKFHE